MILWTTCGLVSFFHGQNDGQKGVGLLMLIFIAILPGQFSVDQSVNLQSINAHVREIQTIVATTDTTEFGKDELKQFHQIQDHAVHFGTLIKSAAFASDIKLTERFSLRKDIVKVTKDAEKDKQQIAEKLVVATERHDSELRSLNEKLR